MRALPQSKVSLACNLGAISAADRPRYNALVMRLRRAFTDKTELEDGYAYILDSTLITLPEIAEWITMEKLCCPFLAFQINVESTGELRMTLRGPDGIKAILEHAMS